MTFRPLWGLTLVCIPAFCLLIWLGTWQVQRLYWKEALIEQVSARLSEAPGDVDVLLKIEQELPTLEYSRVRVTGVFDHSLEAHFYALTAGGAPGYKILTRLRRPGKADVLISRGFVPLDNKDPTTRLAGQVEGAVSFTGLVRVPKGGAAFTPDNQPKDNVWFAYDMDELGVYFGGEAMLPVIVEVEASDVPGGLPRGGQTRVHFINNHLGYILTWYGLSIGLIAVYLTFHYSKGRLTFGMRKDGGQGNDKGSVQ